MKCILCSYDAQEFCGAAFKCLHCGLVFKNPQNFLKIEEETQRYSFHKNTIEDPGYRNFLNRLLVPLESFLPTTFESLDFGCGPGPTLCKMLELKGGSVSNYDPVFYPDESLLKRKYHVVTSTEVVEHFKEPAKDWALLTGLVQTNGVLGIMTQFLDEKIDYQSWWYKNDPTHVSFYNQKTLLWLEETFALEQIFNDQQSVVIFRKKS